MKKSFRLVLLACLLAMPQGLFAEFKLQADVKVTALLDYSDQDYFDVVQIGKGDFVNIRYGLVRVIIYKGEKTISGVVSTGSGAKRLNKKKNIPSEGSFVLKQVVGDYSTKKQMSIFPDIGDDLYGRSSDDSYGVQGVVQSWEIVYNKKRDSFSIWRKVLDLS